MQSRTHVIEYITELHDHTDLIWESTRTNKEGILVELVSSLMQEEEANHYLQCIYSLESHANHGAFSTVTSRQDSTKVRVIFYVDKYDFDLSQTLMQDKQNNIVTFLNKVFCPNQTVWNHADHDRYSKKWEIIDNHIAFMGPSLSYLYDGKHNGSFIMEWLTNPENFKNDALLQDNKHIISEFCNSITQNDGKYYCVHSLPNNRFVLTDLHWLASIKLLQKSTFMPRLLFDNDGIESYTSSTTPSVVRPGHGM